METESFLFINITLTTTIGIHSLSLFSTHYLYTYDLIKISLKEATSLSHIDIV